MTGLGLSTIGVAYLAVLLPFLTILAVPAIIIAVFYFRHRERMAYLQQPPVGPAPGAASAAPGEQPQEGASPASADYPSGYREEYRYRYNYDPYTGRRHPSLYHPMARAGVLLGVGLGIFLGLLTIGIGPWLLAGLFPLFFGLVRIGLLYLEPPVPLPPPQALQVWLQRSLWTGAVGLALLLGLGTLGPSPALLAGTVPLGYAGGLLLAYYLARRGA